jgi:hypothetical protein
MHDLKTHRVMKANPIWGPGHRTQAMCPPSRLLYIDVKFGPMRKNWIDNLKVSQRISNTLG